MNHSFDTLEKWYEAKTKISLLEAKIEKYKRLIEAEMKANNTNKISKGKFNVTKRSMTRTTLSKDNVPVEIWNKYSTKSHYDTFFLKKNEK